MFVVYIYIYLNESDTPFAENVIIIYTLEAPPSVYLKHD